MGRRRGPGPAGPDAMPMPPIFPPAVGPGSASGADRTKRKFPGPAAPGRAVPQAMGLGLLPLTGPLPCPIIVGVYGTQREPGTQPQSAVMKTLNKGALSNAGVCHGTKKMAPDLAWLDGCIVNMHLSVVAC